MLRLLRAGYENYDTHQCPVTERLNWEIYVVAKGEFAPVFEGRKKIPLKKRHIWVMPRGLRYGWRSGKAPLMRYAFHFTSPPNILCNAVDERGYFARPISENEVTRIDQIYHEMDRHFHTFTPLSGLHIERAMIDLALLILEGVPLSSDVPLDQMDEQRVQYALLWYSDNLSECPTVDAVADAVHISAGHLRRIFKKVKGASPHQLLVEMRLKSAKDMLSKTSLTLAQVAKRCGFRSGNDFGRVFIKHTGVSPHRWRTHVTAEEAKTVE